MTSKEKWHFRVDSGQRRRGEENALLGTPGNGGGGGGGGGAGLLQVKLRGDDRGYQGDPGEK